MDSDISLKKVSSNFQMIYGDLANTHFAVSPVNRLSELNNIGHFFEVRDDLLH